MFLGIITFLSALTISGVAIYYSVAGLAAIFAAAVIPIIIMGVSLEVGKLVTAVWLHRNWSRATWWLKTYLSMAVFILMFITSMGIFGFLSKAHIEQTSLSQEQVALIDTLNDKETRSQAKIDRWRGELDRLLKGEDVRVDNLIDKEQEGLDKIYARIKEAKDAFRDDAKFEIEQQQTRIKQAQDRRDAEIAAAEKKFEGTAFGSKAYEDAVKKAKDNELSVASRAQAEILKINTKLDEDLASVDVKYADDIKAINDRIQDLRNQANNKTEDIEGRIAELEGFIDTEQKVIDEVNEEKFGYEKEYRKLEAEVGPIKYIAEFIYGDQADTNMLEEAVRWVIIIIIFVFDPLAVLLLIASQYTFNWYRGNDGDILPPKPKQPKQPEEDSDNFTDGEWEEAHALNKKYDNNTNQEIAKNYSEEPLPPEYVEEENLSTPPEKKDSESLEDSKLEGDDLDKWNEWVRAANEAAEQEKTLSPEEQARLLQVEQLEDDSQWADAKRKWKEENPRQNLKDWKDAFVKGRVQELPWSSYVNKDLAQEKEEEVKKKGSFITKIGTKQIRKDLE